MRAHCHVSSLALTVIAAALSVSAPAAQADPTHTRGVTCIGGGLRAEPEFTQVSPGRAEYHFSGLCTSRTGKSIGYRIDATWTPSETQADNANASEVYHVDTVSGASMPGIAVVGWHCTRDPWLNDADCVRVGATLPVEPAEFWEEFGTKSLPASRLAIPRERRAALREQYALANGQRQRPGLLTRSNTAAGGVDLTPPAQRLSERASASSDDASLNPQPLPPEPPPEVSATTTAIPVAPNREATGIIIVGGKATTPKVLKPTVRSNVQPEKHE